jgi:hypothetical protein
MKLQIASFGKCYIPFHEDQDMESGYLCLVSGELAEYAKREIAMQMSLEDAGRILERLLPKGSFVKALSLDTFGALFMPSGPVTPNIV